MIHLAKPLDDLIISVLLSNHEIKRTPNGKQIIFEIKSEKNNVLVNYLQINKIEKHCHINYKNNQCTIYHSIPLELILKDWTNEQYKLVAINPKKLTASTLILWISLFAEKTDRNVLINTNMSKQVFETLNYYFNNYFNCKLYFRGNFVTIKPFYLILLHSIYLHRPIIEMVELYNLIPAKEIKQFKRELIKNEEDQSTNGFTF